jgi:hypothetical protein
VHHLPPAANRAPPPPLSGIHPPYIGPHYQTTSPPAIRLRKPSHGASVCVVGPNQPPPSRAGQSPLPSPSIPAYPAPNRSPLHTEEAPRDSFAKTEPWRLGFHFLAQIPPPSHIGQSPPPSPSTPAYSAPNRSPLSIDDTPHAQFAKAKPLWLNFGFLAQNLPSLCLAQLPPSRPSIPAYPTPNRSPLSIDDTPHAQFEPLQLGFLFSLHFWSIAPIFAFSTIHQLVFAPVYILFHLHMYVHHQYTILGVQFRCVIS